MQKNYGTEEPLVGSEPKKNYRYKENDPNYKGEPMSEDLTSGIVQNRGCTDILFLFLFVAFWVGMIIIALLAFKTGQPNRLASPYDTDGNHCGYDTGFEDYKYVYFTSPKSGNLSNYACVSECPQNSSSILKCHANSIISSCGTNDGSVYGTAQFITICIPSETAIWEKIKSAVDVDSVTKGLHDLEASWILLVVSALVAFLMGLFTMVMMKFCAPLLVWGIILCYLALVTAGGLLFYFKYNGSYEITQLDFIENQLTDNQQALLGMAIGLWVLAGVSLLLIICLFGRIRLAIAVMEEASNYIRDVVAAFFVPIFMFVVGVAFLVFWFLVTLYLYSTGDITKGETPFAHVSWDTKIKRLLAYYIVAIIWNVEFLIAFTQIVLAFSAAHWYFAQGNPKDTSGNIRKSFWSSLRYHLGSVALGSLILAVIWVVRILVEMAYRQLKNATQNQEGNCIKYCHACVTCCLDCFERFIRYLNTKAFIQIAITGESFCTAAYESFYLVLRNAGRFAALDTVGALVLFFGKVFIAAITGLICYIMLTKIDYFNTEIYSPVVPTVFFVLIAYLVGAFFMSVYGMAADTILQSFCIDEEVHKTHKNMNAQYCPESLRTFVENNAN